MAPASDSEHASGPQRRSSSALELAGRGDGLDAGALRYADAIMAGTEIVLRALVLDESS